MKLNNLILGVVILAFILLLVGKFYFSEDSFSSTNLFWNSIEKFTSFTSINNLYDLSDLSGMREGDVLFIIGPTRNYSKADSAYILSYMGRGGRVVVMDDYGSANSLLENINSSIMLNQQPLCQYDDFYVRGSFPIIKNFTQDSPYRVNSVVLNHPVSLNTTEYDTIIANTTTFGWIDLDDDSNLDWEEYLKEYTVIASAFFDNGQLIVIGDPDIVTDGMIDKGNNKQFISNLIKNDTAYIDMTHGHEVPPLAQLNFVLKNDIVAQLLCIILLLLACYVNYKRTYIMGLLRKSKDSEKEYMGRKEWLVSFMESRYSLKENEINELNKKL